MAIRRTIAEFSDDIATADIADNAVTLAKMAGGTDGQVITYDASGDPVAVGPGTDGQVLTSTGAGSPPAFEAVPSFDADAAQVFNESGADVDFRVEGSGQANALFVQGSDGKVGIGDSAPPNLLTIKADNTSSGSGDNYGQFMIQGATNENARLNFGVDTDASPVYGWIVAGENTVAYRNLCLNPVGGNVGIGITAPDSALHIQRNVNADHATLSVGMFLKSVGGYGVGSSDYLGSIKYGSDSYGANGHYDRAEIKAVGEGNFPGCRLEFYNTGSGGSPNTQRMRINNGGYIDGDENFRDDQFDFAEYFEWADGNPDDEYRAGESVVLVGEKIRIATASDDVEDIIGVISETAGFVGNSANFGWQKRFVKDDFGKKEWIEEDRIGWIDYAEGVEHDYKIAEVPEGVTVPDDVSPHVAITEKMNPDFDESLEYVERHLRKEWTIVGFLGQVAIKKTSPKGANWIKLKEISETVEQWLVR